MTTGPPEEHLLVLVVAHTHWDREWYRTAARFRPRLVALIDELLQGVAGSPFLLDGQAVVLEDYLEWRPECAADLSRALRAGGLEAGPWYVLADELIPSGEGLVRNLLAGRRVLSALRAAPPPVLY
ncbi:MAG: alpha-mannosidase, partial [Gemmatimonadaceae bacterium]|nr:alpha-mannosidase [Gemmatimonadaceae bacterium]